MPNQEAKTRKQQKAEAEVEGFRRDLGPFVVAAESSRMPMVFTDASASPLPIIFANDAFLALTGYDRSELLGQPFAFLLTSRADGGARARLQGQVEAAFDEGVEDSVDIQCRRKDGSAFWAAMCASPVRDATGKVVQHFVSFIDLTRHRREADHLRFLLDELNHRTQNTLATVQAIATQTLRGAASDEVIDAFTGRIMALSKAHSLLGRENWAAVSLRDVVGQILGPFGLGGRQRERFLIQGEDVRLPPKIAVILAMVFQELATNAVKHGSLSRGEAGTVHIDWRVEPSTRGDLLRLGWREAGGPRVTPPRRKGFGSRLLEGGLAHELDGEIRLDYQPEGLECLIVCPCRPAQVGEP